MTSTTRIFLSLAVCGFAFLCGCSRERYIQGRGDGGQFNVQHAVAYNGRPDATNDRPVNAATNSSLAALTDAKVVLLLDQSGMVPLSGTLPDHPAWGFVLDCLIHTLTVDLRYHVLLDRRSLEGAIKLRRRAPHTFGRAPHPFAQYLVLYLNESLRRGRFSPEELRHASEMYKWDPGITWLSPNVGIAPAKSENVLRISITLQWSTRVYSRSVPVIGGGTIPGGSEDVEVFASELQISQKGKRLHRKKFPEVVPDGYKVGELEPSTRSIRLLQTELLSVLPKVIDP